MYKLYQCSSWGYHKFHKCSSVSYGKVTKSKGTIVFYGKATKSKGTNLSGFWSDRTWFPEFGQNENWMIHKSTVLLLLWCTPSVSTPPCSCCAENDPLPPDVADLSWEMLRMLLSLTTDEALRLLDAVSDFVIDIHITMVVCDKHSRTCDCLW